MELKASVINKKLFKPLEKYSQHLLGKFEYEVAGFRSSRDSGGRLEMPEEGVPSNANTSLEKASDRSGGAQVELLSLSSVLMSMFLTMLATATLERTVPLQFISIVISGGCHISNGARRCSAAV